MEKKDGRALPHAVREEIRRRAVSRVLAGESPEVVIESLGFHRSCIYDWLNRYRRRGEAGLATKPIPGRPRKFDDALWADELRALIRNDPRQLDFPDALWTRAMIRELLRRQFKAKVSERTVGNILKRLDITVQRPRLKAVEQDPEAVKRWLNKEWPQIRVQAKAANAVIFFGDESHLRSDAHRGRTWGMKGETAIVAKTGTRFSLNLFSAVSPLGELRFMVTDQRVNAASFIDFLRRLLVNAERPIYLVLDDHPVYRSKKVRDFVAIQDGKLKLLFLPPYSLELNPDQLVWSVVKGSGRTLVENQETAHQTPQVSRIHRLITASRIDMNGALSKSLLMHTFFSCFCLRVRNLSSLMWISMGHFGLRKGGGLFSSRPMPAG